MPTNDLTVPAQEQVYSIACGGTSEIYDEATAYHTLVSIALTHMDEEQLKAYLSEVRQELKTPESPLSQVVESSEELTWEIDALLGDSHAY